MRIIDKICLILLAICIFLFFVSMEYRQALIKQNQEVLVVPYYEKIDTELPEKVNI